jgi:hypothetical protein
MLENLNIRDIKAGDIYWESDDHQDACFIALTDAHHEGQGTAVNAVDILTGKPCHHYEHERAGGYGVRLYTAPQYTRPDWARLLACLSALLREWASEAARLGVVKAQAADDAARAATDALSGEQARVKLLTEENAKLRMVLDKVADQCDHFDVLNFGVTLAGRVKHIIETEGRPWMK